MKRNRLSWLVLALAALALVAAACSGMTASERAQSSRDGDALAGEPVDPANRSPDEVVLADGESDAPARNGAEPAPGDGGTPGAIEPRTGDPDSPVTDSPDAYPTPTPRLDDPNRFPAASPPPGSSTPDGGGSTPPGGSGSNGSPPDTVSPFPTQLERAPIDGLELIVRESHPPQYALHIVSGLPNGCARYSHTDVERSGTTITVSVWNTMPASDEVYCTMVYGMHEHTLELGSDFESGREYTVNVNGEVLKFVAR